MELGREYHTKVGDRGVLIAALALDVNESRGSGHFFYYMLRKNRRRGKKI